VLRSRIRTLPLLVAAALGCAADVAERPAAPGVDELTAIDAELERRASGRWPSWSMELDERGLALRVELDPHSSASEVAAECTEIAHLVRERVGRSGDWRVEVAREGLVVARCADRDSTRRHASGGGDPKAPSG
jgi:hypothetical protein